jgi:hypothetical protein
LLETLLLKIFLDFDNKWKIIETAPMGTAGKSVEDDEILKDSFSYAINYRELISDVFVEYADSEVVDRTSNTSSSVKRVGATNTRVKVLHKVEKQKTFKSLHFIESEAQKLADRLLYVFSNRLGTAKFSTKNRFFDTILGDVIDVSRTRLIGNEWDGTSVFSRKFLVNSTSKGLNQIDVEADDQFGIEANSTSW